MQKGTAAQGSNHWPTNMIAGYQGLYRTAWTESWNLFIWICSSTCISELSAVAACVPAELDKVLTPCSGSAPWSVPKKICTIEKLGKSSDLSWSGYIFPPIETATPLWFFLKNWGCSFLTTYGWSTYISSGLLQLPADVAKIAMWSRTYWGYCSRSSGRWNKQGVSDLM